MKHVSKTTAGIAAGQLPESQDQSKALDEASASIVNRLFAELQSIFPAWRQAWPDEKALGAAKKTWTKAFIAAGINRIEQIQHGLRQCRLHAGDFVPSSGKFVSWCRVTPEQLGLPDEELAYREACRNAHPAMLGHERWSHKAIYHAALKCGMHSLRTLPADASRMKFQQAYRDIAQQIDRGVELLEPVPALPADVTRKGDPEKARAALDAMRNKLVGGSDA